MVVTHYNLDMKKTSLDSFLEWLHPRASYSNGSKIVKRQEQGPEKSSRGLCAERTAGMGGRKLIDRSTAGGGWHFICPVNRFRKYNRLVLRKLKYDFCDSNFPCSFGIFLSIKLLSF